MNLTQKRLEVILFDLGDTLIYFDGDWPRVFEEARTALLSSLLASGVNVDQAFIDDFYTRMQEYYRERETEFIEHTTRYVLCAALTARGLGDISDTILKDALAVFHTVTQSHWIPEDDLLPTMEILRERGYRMAVISNAADDENTQMLIDKAKIRDYFELILTSAAEGIRKPNPKIFETALRIMATNPERAVMVGDTLGADILGARNAGIYSIWITRRADTPNNRAHRDTITPNAQISTLIELPEILDRLQGS